MPTTDDLKAFNDALRALAESLTALVSAKYPRKGSWRSVVLDARLADDGSVLDKVRVTLAKKRVVGLQSTSDQTLQLIALGEKRPRGKHRWYGLRLEVGSDGTSKVEFTYDPSCTEDPDFFTS